ncbi:hypothetical protein J437_LFUL000894 [Ladona fulva]|uniref:Uncharacterized protein n=1 Tax=Ladona fulva TaxID=123851 RepID=A0A8K0K7N6_LADFU|nr:hypothetical protein J437_LFUL000894 [Ladona fulva]
MQYDDHQQSECILRNLALGLISQVPLDYMHLVCLGVMKRLIRLWVENGSKSETQNSKIFQILESYRILAFLLYYGPCVLINILPNEMYTHVLVLTSAIYVLCSDLSSQSSWRSFANNLLHRSLEDIPKLCEELLLIYNFHNLLHLSNDDDS